MTSPSLPSGSNAGSASSIPRPLRTKALTPRGGEAELPLSSDIRDPLLRQAFDAAFEAWARKYPELLEDV